MVATGAAASGINPFGPDAGTGGKLCKPEMLSTTPESASGMLGIL